MNTHDCTNRSAREWYLPHHPVINPNKSGKVRRVPNGAAKFHGSSLNKTLLVGPDLLQNLLAVLMRFRQHQYAVLAGIEGMFLQVGVLPIDQLSLRFLWREDPTTDVVTYHYTRTISELVTRPHVLILLFKRQLAIIKSCSPTQRQP